MNAQLMDGAALAARMREEVGKEVAELGHVGLATVLVGDDPASDVYIRLKHKAADAAGIEAIDHRLPAVTTEDDLLSLVRELNEHERIDGILVQTPLPEQIDETRVMRTIDPIKDVDGLHPFNAGQLYLGRQTFVPATPLGVMRLLAEYRVQIAGARAVVVGRSALVGKPMAMLLLQANATVTICHSRTRRPCAPHARCRSPGRSGRPSGRDHGGHGQAGATVVDVGITRTEDGLVGDVEADVAEVAALLSPVPGGVGPMTIAALLGNAVRAARYRQGKLAFPLI